MGFFICTITGGSRRAEKSREVLSNWGGQELEQERSTSGPRARPGRAEAGQGRSKAEVGTEQEQGGSR